MLQTVNNKVMLSDTPYNVGKKLVQVYIPALSTLYFGLGSIWGLPAVEQVVGTFACVATFGGVCLGLSSNSYDKSGAALQKLEDASGHDGELEITENEHGHKVFSLNLNGDPEELAEKGSISFKVAPKPPV